MFSRTKPPEQYFELLPRPMHDKNLYHVQTGYLMQEAGYSLDTAMRLFPGRSIGYPVDVVGLRGSRASMMYWDHAGHAPH